jgi:hypothetical protein
MLPAMTIFVAAAHALALNGHMMRPAAARGMQPRTAARRPSMVSLPFGGGGAASRCALRSRTGPASNPSHCSSHALCALLRAHSGPSEEVLASYRLMGLDIDASYDEIEVVFNDLLEQYQKEPKRKIKLQVAKDKILDDRLRVAMSSKSGFAADPFAWKGPKPPRFTIPPALQGVMELPDKETLGKNAFVFGAIGLLPAITAAWASTSVGLGFAISLYLLYNRGVPDSGDMGADMRAPRVRRARALGGGAADVCGDASGVRSSLACALAMCVLAHRARARLRVRARSRSRC